VKTGEGTNRTLWSRSPIKWILANGITPPVFPTSENLYRYVEDLNDARTPLADFINSLLRPDPVNFAHVLHPTHTANDPSDIVWDRDHP